MTEPGVYITRQVLLTSREMETLELLAQGLGDKEIARRLFVSIHGAKRLIASIRAKFDAHTRTEAVVKAIRAGLIDVDEAGMK